ncbi:fumarate hydratase [Sphingobacterium lactis]|uniref:fumarate hydratase n=1 Tax=Sphingobacterium lactis TaxID=797291 RepID=UPI003DA63A8A
MNRTKSTYFPWIAYLSLCLGMLSIFAGCQRHSDMQDEGEDYLQGIWVQDSIPGQAAMLNYTIHEMKFTCDSIYVTMHVHNKVKSIPDSCYGDGTWTETAKAVYSVRQDSMIVEGVYTKPNGKQKISGCHKHGQYIPRFMISAKGGDSLILENKFEGRPIVLRKTADITCVPKKRWEL